MEDYDPQSLESLPKEKLLVFLVSTYGEGDPPDNALKFCMNLQKMQKKGVKLNGLRYIALGMGNKTYKHFNQTIKVCLLSIDC
jgi:NADPH-ferrihemoprotein reductase